MIGGEYGFYIMAAFGGAIVLLMALYSVSVVQLKHLREADEA